VALARQNAPVIDAPLTLARELRDDPRVLPQRASELAITQDVAVDRAVLMLNSAPMRSAPAIRPGLHFLRSKA